MIYIGTTRIGKGLMMDNLGDIYNLEPYMSVEFGPWTEIGRFTSSNQMTLPSNGCTRLGLWVVGGGGSGASEHYTSGHAGDGGSGGQSLAYGINSPIPYTAGAQLTVTIGAGGVKTETGTDKAGSDGGNTTVLYGGSSYIAAGGLRGPSDYSHNQKVEGSGLGGWRGSVPTYYYKNEGEGGLLGGDGLLNPFDESDTNLYGAGGGAGFNSNDQWSSQGSAYPNGLAGGDTGGGGGGYGASNNPLNAGRAGTFYGAGGGGGAFSSNHTYGCGGAGYQGIVIVYGHM